MSEPTSPLANPQDKGPIGDAYPQTAADQKFIEMGYDMLGEQRRAVALAGLRIGEPVLDVATGSGRMTLSLVEAGYRVISGDISEEVVRETRERICGLVGDAVEFHVLNAVHLDLADASISSIATANAMHHMEEPERVLEEMTRVLRPDGTLLLVEFNEHGFDVVEHVRQAVHHEHHERGKISAQATREFLQAHFERVEEHALALNTVWIARGKRFVS